MERWGGQPDPGARLGQLTSAPVLVAGTYQQQLGVGTVRFWLYLASFLPQSVLITWVYTTTQSAAFCRGFAAFHDQLHREILALSLRGELFQSALWMISALLVMRRLRTATPDGAGRSGRGESTDAISARRRS